jgi:hypothetical protein
LPRRIGMTIRTELFDGMRPGKAALALCSSAPGAANFREISPMNAAETFASFVTRVLEPAKARRFAVLASSKKGQRKALDGLCHDFEPAIRQAANSTKDYSNLWDQPCYAFHPRLGFGTPFSTLREAYQALALEDSWLIVLQDASAGIHRPEWRRDAERLIVG